MSLDDLFKSLAYNPHAGQVAFHRSDARFKVLIAGARFGKSLAASRDVIREIVSGPTRGWLVAPTFELARPEFNYIRTDIIEGLHAKLNETAHPPRLVTDWGAEVSCMSAHTPVSLLGQEVDWMVLCEAAHIERDAFERFLRARLASRGGRLVVPTTPHGHNWIHELYKRGQQHECAWESFRHATWENPHVPEHEITAARRELPQDTFAEQYGGEFTSSHGQVYREFRPELHVVNGLEPPPGAIVFKAIDFGYTNPFACIWGTLDADGRLLILREHYDRKLALPTHAERIRAIDAEFRQRGCEIGPSFADPSGALERRMLEDEGITTRPGDNRISGGIEIVRRRLLSMTDGRPGLLIDARCTNLLRELPGYVWDESAEHRLPHKHDDHALDALRYLCVALARKVDWKNTGTLW